MAFTFTSTHVSLKGQWKSFFEEACIPTAEAEEFADKFASEKMLLIMLPDLNEDRLQSLGITLLGYKIAILKHAKKVIEKDGQDEREAMLVQHQELTNELNELKRNDIKSKEQITMLTAESKQLQQELAAAYEDNACKLIEIKRLTTLLDNARSKNLTLPDHVLITRESFQKMQNDLLDLKKKYAELHVGECANAIVNILNSYDGEVLRQFTNFCGMTDADYTTFKAELAEYSRRRRQVAHPGDRDRLALEKFSVEQVRDSLIRSGNQDGVFPKN